MRHSVLLALPAALLAALPAQATPLDTITFAFADLTLPSYPGLPPRVIPGVDFTATLPASPIPVPDGLPGPPPAAGFFFNTDGLPFSAQPPGAPGTTFFFGPTSVFFVPTANTNIPQAYHYFSLLSPTPLYTGSDAAPTLAPGVYAADYFVTIFGTYTLPGTITIAPVTPSTSTVPEPAPFLLAGTGVLALCAASRLRRTHASKL